MLAQILLEPKHPLYLRKGKLVPLIEAARSSSIEAQLLYGDKDITEIEQRQKDPRYRHYGVTLWEVLFVWLLVKVSDTAVKKITELLIEWANHRLKGDKGKQSRSVTLYDPDGKPLKTIKVDKGMEEIENGGLLRIPHGYERSRSIWLGRVPDEGGETYMDKESELGLWGIKEEFNCPECGGTVCLTVEAPKYVEDYMLREDQDQQLLEQLRSWECKCRIGNWVRSGIPIRFREALHAAVDKMCDEWAPAETR
jgi:hypothetical protein